MNFKIKEKYTDTNAPYFVALKLILSAGLLWFLMRHTKFNAAELLRADPRYLLAALALLVLQPVLGAVRWRLFLRGFKANLVFSRAIVINFISCFFSLILPALIGADAVRVWYARRNHIKMDAAVSSVIADRLVALVAVLCMIIVSLPFAPSIITDPNVLMSLRIIGAAGGTGILILLFADRLLKRWQKWRWAHILAWPSRMAALVLLVWPMTWRGMALSLSVHAMTCLSAGLIALAYGTSLPISALFVLMPPVILALGMPISIGGWGVREAAMVAALASIGIASNTAFLIALTLGLIASAATLPGLVFWVIYRHKDT